MAKVQKDLLAIERQKLDMEFSVMDGFPAAVREKYMAAGPKQVLFSLQTES